VSLLRENSHQRCDENIFPYHGAHNHEFFALEHEVTSAVRELAPEASKRCKRQETETDERTQVLRRRSLEPVKHQIQPTTEG
jgi:hypothetical protein